MEQPWDPGISLLGTCLKETKTLFQKDACTPMFITALFTIAKIQKQAKCPSTWIKKIWCIYTMEYYSAIKKEWNFAICSNMDGLEGHYAKWNKSEKDKYIRHDLYVKSRIQQTSVYNKKKKNDSQI